MQKTVDSNTVAFDDDGFLLEKDTWSKELASSVAQDIGISLTDDHWKVIDYIRSEHEKGSELSIRKVGTSGVVDIKQFYTLFPGGPLKNACRIAGLPKPKSCL